MFRFFYFLLVILSFAGVQVHMMVVEEEEDSSEVKPVAYGTTIEVCYGSPLTAVWGDMGYTYNRRIMGYILSDNLTMFFTPSRPGSQRIQVSDNGVVLDPHYNFTNFKFKVHNVTEKDDGRFSVLMDGILTYVLTLEIIDCAEEVISKYGDTYSFSSLHFYYAYALYFARQWYSDEPAVLLWNRTGNPQSVVGRMGRLVGDKWMIELTTQSEHSGYYTFRDKNGELAFRRKMVVEEMYKYCDTLNGEEFLFSLEIGPDVSGMTFTPHFGGATRVLMTSGEMVIDWEWVFDGRMSVSRSTAGQLHIRITDVQPSDAGLLEIRDQQGNLALVVELDTPEGSSHETYISICVAVVVLLVLVVCCVCVRKHKNKSRRNNSAPLSEAAAAGGGAVSFTDFQDTTQPSTSAHPSSSHGPTYSAPLSPKEPGSTDHQPLVAPGPVQSISASGLPVFIHPTIHF